MQLHRDSNVRDVGRMFTVERSQMPQPVKLKQTRWTILKISNLKKNPNSFIQHRKAGRRAKIYVGDMVQKFMG